MRHLVTAVTCLIPTARGVVPWPGMNVSDLQRLMLLTAWKHYWWRWPSSLTEIFACHISTHVTGFLYLSAHIILSEDATDYPLLFLTMYACEWHSQGWVTPKSEMNTIEVELRLCFQQGDIKPIIPLIVDCSKKFHSSQESYF